MRLGPRLSYWRRKTPEPESAPAGGRPDTFASDSYARSTTVQHHFGVNTAVLVGRFRFALYLSRLRRQKDIYITKTKIEGNELSPETSEEHT